MNIYLYLKKYLETTGQYDILSCVKYTTST